MENKFPNINGKRLLIEVQYQYDDNKAWRDSYLKNTVIKPETSDIKEFIRSALESHDYIEVTKTSPFEAMYRDNPDGTAIQTGYVVRFKDEIDGKRFFGEAWVSISEVVSLF